MRIGIGYDIHRFSKTRKLIIGGVEISAPYGLMGHSDADVVLHSISDAMLGAAGLGDIGRYFPPTDDKYRGISSLKILGRVNQMVKKKRYKINNIDVTVIAEVPKLIHYVAKMKQVIAKQLTLSPSLINIKATTNERMGSIGRKEGIAAISIVLLK